MSDFPRGWFLTTGSVAAGLTPSITVPATAGVVHVLDAYYATLVSFAAAAAATAPQIQITAPAIGAVDSLAFNGGAVGRDSVSGSNVDIATAPGAALTISLTAAVPANYLALITIQGHDI